MCHNRDNAATAYPRLGGPATKAQPSGWAFFYVPRKDTQMPNIHIDTDRNTVFEKDPMTPELRSKIATAAEATKKLIEEHFVLGFDLHSDTHFGELSCPACVENTKAFMDGV